MKITSLALAAAIGLTLAACSPKSEAPKEPAAAETAAPAETAKAPGAFSIGEYQALSLLDGTLEFPNDNKVVGVGKTAEEVAAVLTAAGLPTDKLGLTIEPLLVKAGDKVLLFDTGAGTNFGPTAGKLGQSLTEAGVEAASVTDIFISHVHGDHVGGLVNADGALVFPNATVHIGAADWAFLQGLSAENGAKVGVGNPVALVTAVTPKVDAFKPGADLVPGVVQAVDIKGHTPGHSGYLIGAGADSVLYIGDTMHHYVVSVQKPDWTIAFDHDAPTAQKSRAEVLAQSAASGQRIYAVHFPYPGLGKFEKRGEEFVWVAE
ncbi:MBL fold metallo-hydrolase [Steroidobacter sp.]|uniref:MBL fold metallo-hydrolase n=1 Tax=Steroidobacter sp. TaxID=1978227 RepID=UPI001A635F1F|nr:MBL fold metallo-hydrolase [Steroidobacter sp.]MBL8271033.1 MBL fold metallo-hydrolase [Steroidobacter sp.]